VLPEIGKRRAFKTKFTPVAVAAAPVFFVEIALWIGLTISLQTIDRWKAV